MWWICTLVSWEMGGLDNWVIGESGMGNLRIEVGKLTATQLTHFTMSTSPNFSLSVAQFHNRHMSQSHYFATQLVNKKPLCLFSSLKKLIFLKNSKNSMRKELLTEYVCLMIN